MNDLPQEIIDRITHYLAREEYRSTLLISRKFQYAVERASGAFACFAFKDQNFKERQEFVATFSGHRFRYLRRVEIHTSFPALEPRRREPTRRDRKKKRDPTPEPELGPCRESLEDLQEKDKTFTDQVTQAFEAIKKVEGAEGESVGRLQLIVFTPTRQVHKCYCDHRRYSSWRVHLLSPETLPKLHSVHGLSVCNPEPRHCDEKTAQSRIDLRVIVDLAARCPNLEYLRCKAGADEWTSTADPVLEHFKENHAGCLRDTRNDFANAIQTVQLPVSLQHVQLDFIGNVYDAIVEQRRPLPDLNYPEPYDSFSSSLRILSPQLRKMEIKVMADRTLFWPHESNEATSWPNLESLNVMFHIGSPSGSWYFHGPSGEGKHSEDSFNPGELPYPTLQYDDGDEGWHYASSENLPKNSPTFRVVPTEETIVPFLESFAKAVANMPKLKEALLWAPLEFHLDTGEEEEEAEEEGDEEGAESDASGADDRSSIEEINKDFDRNALALYPDDSLAWGIAYVAPGGLAFDGGENDSSSPQLWWRVGHWRPSDELHQLFRKIGEAQRTSPLLEYWTDPKYGDGLVALEWFSNETIFPF